MLNVQTKPKRDYHVFLKRGPIKLLNKYVRWRKVAEILKISKTARLRLEWIIYYHQGHNASQSARRFGISRKTFYKWFNEFDEDNIYTMYNLQDRSKAPHHVRQKPETKKLREANHVGRATSHIDFWCRWHRVKI